MGAAETARDLAIRGPDALVAGRALNRSGNPLFVFNVSETALPGLRSTFESLAAELCLGASIEILDERVHTVSV